MIQNDFLNLGKSGCYFLCICHAFGVQDYMVLDYYRKAVLKGYIDEDCYIKDPRALVAFICGKKVNVVKSDKERTAYVKIAYFFNKRTGLHHFVLKTGDNEWWDPLGESVTRKEGIIESWRLYDLVG